MRVGFIGNIPLPIGGAEVFLQGFLTHFLRRGNTGALVRWRKQVFMYFPERLTRVYAAPGTVERRRSLTVHYLLEALEHGPRERDEAYEERLLPHYLRQCAQARDVLAQARVQLVQAHMLYPNILFAGIAAASLSVPFVLTVHGMLEFRILEYMATRCPRVARQVRALIPKAACVVAVSDEVAQACRRWGARRVLRIGGGIDTRVFRPRHGSSRPRDIVFVGSVRREKGAALLIRAFEQLDGAVDGRLIFVGRPLLPDSEIQRARRHPRIRLLGERDEASVRRIVQGARCVVLPSANEGLPMSVLEAMACETPVLVTPTGQLARLITHGRNGFVIRSRTPSALAAALRHLVARPDLAAVGRAARRTALAYDIRGVVGQYEQLYRRLLHG